MNAAAAWLCWPPGPLNDAPGSVRHVGDSTQTVCTYSRAKLSPFLRPLTIRQAGGTSPRYPFESITCRPRASEARQAQSRSLGYAHWPELFHLYEALWMQSRSLGYAHWPEPTRSPGTRAQQSRSLGYAHWPERHGGCAVIGHESRSLRYAHWPELLLCSQRDVLESRSLGYAHWPEPGQHGVICPQPPRPHSPPSPAASSPC